jgi:hypothetical protein
MNAAAPTNVPAIGQMDAFHAEVALPATQRELPARADASPNMHSIEEMDAFHVDDLHAAKIVVGLLMSVFTFGLLMYAIIMWIVW